MPDEVVFFLVRFFSSSSLPKREFPRLRSIEEMRSHKDNASAAVRVIGSLREEEPTPARFPAVKTIHCLPVSIAFARIRHPNIEAMC